MTDWSTIKPIIGLENFPDWAQSALNEKESLKNFLKPYSPDEVSYSLRLGNYVARVEIDTPIGTIPLNLGKPQEAL